jgi:hypothetical protein
VHQVGYYPQASEGSCKYKNTSKQQVQGRNNFSGKYSSV